MINKKTIHLVYDEWDGDKRILNCSNFLGNHEFRDEVGFYDLYNRFCREYYNLNYSIFEFKGCEIGNVYANKDINFLYFIKLSDDIVNIFERTDFRFTTKLMDCLRVCDNLKVVFLYEHESDNVVSFIKIRRLILDNKLDESKFYIISRNSSLEEYIKEFDSKINVWTSNVIDLTTSVILNALKINFLEDKRGKFFMCHNKTHKPHRYALLTMLREHDLLDQVSWSYISGTELHESHLEHVQYFLENDVFQRHVPFIKDLFKIKLKKSDFETDKKYYYDDDQLVHEDLPKLTGVSGVGGGLMIPEYVETYENSYINLITESQYHNWKNVIQISEKTLRPFWGYQIPLILATHGHIRKTKSKYGFDFFDDIINHEYDNVKNEKERLKEYVKEVVRLNSIKNDIILFYKNNRDRLEKNKEIISKLPDDMSDINYLLNL